MTTYIWFQTNSSKHYLPKLTNYWFLIAETVSPNIPQVTDVISGKNQGPANQKKCWSCYERRQEIPQINESLKIISQMVDQHQIKSSIMILDDRNELEKSFFRYLASSLNFSDSLLGSTLFYGLANRTFESYAYYRKDNSNIVVAFSLRSIHKRP